jgi:SecD/SecF fusion protein
LQSRSYLFLLLVGVLVVIFGAFYRMTDYQLGLDINGGSRFVFQMVLDKDPAKQATQKEHLVTLQEDVIRILMHRAGGPLNVLDAPVYAKGPDQVVVELPGITDTDKALKILNTSASIHLYWAKNVNTEQKHYRRYSEHPIEWKDGSPSVTFADGSLDIKPGTEPYAAMIGDWKEILGGESLEDAKPVAFGSAFRPTFMFKEPGSTSLDHWSREHNTDGEKIAFVLDGVVLSINPLEHGAILSDHAEIGGEWTAENAKSLTDLIRSGALPCELKVVSTEKVDPTIGKFALNQIINAGMIAFGVISLFLIAYYSVPGFVAFLALVLYCFFTLTTLKLINSTFSLAGIAGFILSVGMAVDANILVFERFKEEMLAGKSLKSAMELGFKRALPAIIDSNACTILTSIVLVNLGTGPVKGFATTLIIGVAISLFTAVMVTRSLLLFVVGSGIAKNPKLYAADRSWFKRFEEKSHHEPLLVVQKAKKWFALSAITILVGVPFAFMGGFKLNVEFLGGVQATYQVDAAANSTDLEHHLEAAGLKGGNVKLGSDKQGNKLAIITLPNSAQTEAVKDHPDQLSALIGSSAGITGAAKELTTIGPAIQHEIIQNAVEAVILSSILIVVFLAFRFGFSVGGFMGGLRFGVSAIGALVHDILVVFFLAAFVGYFAHWDISSLFITAMLTIIGFSVHDTIVVFDRMRENLRKPLPSEDLAHLMNRSITQSFARSINTSMTVIVTLAILVGFGTATVDLKFFCVAMLVGILSGTYSSIYNASPILYLWDQAICKTDPLKGLIGLSASEAARARMVQTVATPVVPSAPRPAATVAPEPTQSPTGRTYSQVKRRANQAQKGINIDDDDMP